MTRLRPAFAAASAWLRRGFVCLCLALPGLLPAKAWVLLDPGHGGTDHGVTVNGVKEAELVRDIATRVEALLKLRGVEVRNTRSQGEGLSLAARVAYANSLRPGCMVSLHINASFQPASQGPRIFVPAEGKVDEPDAPLWEQAARVRAASSRALGQALAKALGVTGPRPVQSLKLALFRGLSVPVAQVELGFASHEDSASAMGGAAWRQDMAGRVANGIAAYLDLLAGADDAAP